MGLQFRIGLVALLLLPFSASAARVATKTDMANEHQWPMCPYKYRLEDGEMVGGHSSYNCHLSATGHGNTCPSLQQARLKTVRTFQAANYNEFLNRAKNFEIKPLFDKTEKIRGLESYEEMVRMHVDGLMHPDVVEIEDKLLLKDLLKKLEIPATETYFGAHKDDWDINAFKRSLGHLCLTGVDSFIIKAVHLAWSAGQKIVTGWQNDCPHNSSTNAKLEELAEFVDKEIMGQLASEADGHLREYVKPGMTMEALFKTGGHSKRPLEAKVQVLWGKVHHMFFVGEDSRGCVSYQGAWSVLGDRTGWNLNGISGSDEVAELVMNQAFDDLVKHSEKFATEVGADVMRVDFFIGFRDGGKVEIRMNEAESVSGARYAWERDGLGKAWVDGYVLSDRMKMTSGKWDMIYMETERARSNANLD